MRAPTVAIGVPVYNGARTLAGALASLSAQEYPSLRIVVSDNGSTDETPRLLTEAADRDRRIELHRVDENRGAIWNFNRVFELSDGADYFCWSAADDQRAPAFVALTVAALEAAPSAALCSVQTILIAPDGRRDVVGDVLEARGDVRARFAAVLDRRWWPYAIYGLFRASTLARTQLFRNVLGADLGLLADVALYGEIVQVREPLFTYRLSGEPTLDDYYRRLSHTLDPDRPFTSFSSVRWPLARAHLASIARAPLDAATRTALTAAVLRWFAFSRGTVDELLRIAQSALGPRRFDELRRLARRVRGRQE